MKPSHQNDTEEIKRHFDEKTAEAKRHFDVVAEKLEDKISLIAEQHGDIKKTLDEHTKTLEKIESKLDNVAYRFELVELQKRVEALEKKAGIQHSS